MHPYCYYCKIYNKQASVKQYDYYTANSYISHIFLSYKTKCTDQEVEDTKSKYVKRDAYVTMIVEPAQHSYT